MADYRGIFSLQQLYEEQQSDNWAVAEESSFTKPPYSLDWQYGYAVGGSDRNTPMLTSVDRVDFSNDLATASVRGPLAAGRGYNNSVSSRTFGYSTGGRGPTFPSYTSDTQRISYANDTATAVPKGNLSQPWSTGQAVDTINYGYILGGYKPPTNGTLTNRIDFSNDTAAAVPKGNMDVDRYNGSGCGNEDYGYAGAGLINSNANNSSSTSRMDYANDTNTLISRGNLSSEKRTTLSSSNANFGYWAGYSPSTRVDKFDFSNDTAAAVVVGDLPNSQFYSGATGNASFGYYMAGYRVAPSMQTTVNRLDYSNDTVSMSVRGPVTKEKLGFNAASAQSNAKTGTPLSIATQNVGITTTGTAVNSENPSQFNYGGWGYFAGGYDIPPRRSSVERIDLSNDTVNTTQRANMSEIKQEQIDMSSLTHGYATGGYNGSSTVSSTFRIDFSNDTATPVTTGPFTRIITTTHACGTSDYSWTGGGGSPNSVSNIERYDFSNDSATGLSRGNLDVTKQAMMAVGNLNYGYYAGGYFSSPIVRKSDVCRIEYANDTATAVPKANLPEIRQQGSPISNIHYGYLFGGYNGSTGTTSGYRLDYSNDEAQAPSRLNMITQLQNGACFSNHTYGYIGGGYASAETSSVQRVDFANDTATCLTRGVMVETRASATGHHSGNNVNFKPPSQINDSKGPLAVANTAQQYGYVAGGDYGPDVTTVERIDYANDTSGTSVRAATLPTAHYGASFVGNVNYGYYGGGFTPGPNAKSSVFRIDYSNDTAMGTVGPLATTQGFFGSMATGNNDYGWFGGGYSSSSLVMRIDYANDEATASTRGPLAASKYGMAATGNMNYGYWSGGHPGPISNVYRVDYSNDTPTSATKGPISQARRYLAATGNLNYGYVGGGNSPGPTSYSIIDRIDYSNDTATASPKGPLTQPRYQLTATGNKSYGYWFGGYYPSSYSTVDRVDFSNDTATAPTRGFITQARYDLTSASAAANGLPQG